VIDVLFFHTPDGGDIHVDGAGVRTCNGLQTAVYISLFGGNDAGGGWWGNALEGSEVGRVRPQTQEILRALPLTSGNLPRLLAAVEADLQWIVDAGHVEGISATVAASGLNRVEIGVKVYMTSGNEEFKFSEVWETG